MIADFIRSIVDYGLEKVVDRWYGKYNAIVTDNADPKGLGRVKVKCPAVAGDDELPLWIYPSDEKRSGESAGSFWPPEVGDPVKITFENGNSKWPVYEGGWYGSAEGNKVHAALAPDAGKAPTRRGWVTKKGHMLFFDDADGAELVQIVWSAGSESGAKKAAISIDKDGSISLVSASGRRLQLDEANKQFFFSDIDDQGNAVNTLSMHVDRGLYLSVASGGQAQAVVSMDPSGDVEVQAQGAVNVTAPSVSLAAGQVAIGGVKATYSMVLGEQLVTLLSQLIAQVSALTVNTGTGISTPPNNAAAISALASQLSTLLSTAHKVAATP